jgi:hypothetical protein
MMEETLVAVHCSSSTTTSAKHLHAYTLRSRTQPPANTHAISLTMSSDS